MISNKNHENQVLPIFDDNGCSRMCAEYLTDRRNCRVSNGDPLYELDMEMARVPLYKH